MYIEYKKFFYLQGIVTVCDLCRSLQCTKIDCEVTILSFMQFPRPRTTSDSYFLFTNEPAFISMSPKNYTANICSQIAIKV